ncbi:ParB/RepB/Spo0J family partition protein [Pelagibacterium luteolum]|uniref:Chromosome partitioning protein, ParB family n=1 Tax=Pelagibacterium luteolum TaxID=440168 RepID=A0A1G7YKX6_9HYPH|nr:ParB/RepB/Spo0J family partition protein [Pelagibacterium luteolum]SDG97143.1 chromosome partitioning protein, ParB family [Pelagibacterium luteolum]
MARTSKKAKPAPVETMDVVADTEIRSIGDIAAKVTASVAGPDAGDAAPAQAVESEDGTVADDTVFIPLDKLKKHPGNARKTPHSAASIEGKAASIAAKGLLQNLVVEPERDAEGAETGFCLVSIGEGRRLAQLLRVERGEIDMSEPMRCVIDTTNDPAEISLDENVNREDLHPADEFEKFHELAETRGLGPEEIAARFGVTATVVRQRLRLANVSPRLIQLYRDGELTMDQLQAFAITDDHDRQEQVFDGLSYNRDPSFIRRELTDGHVPASDRRAAFVGAEAYLEAGGSIVRDLFTEDRGGFFEDAALLDRLTIEKLEAAAEEIREAEGWKWAEASISFVYAYNMRRIYPEPVDLSEDDDATLIAAHEDYDTLTEKYQDADELPPDVDERFGELEAEIERLEAKQSAYVPEDVARAGVFVALASDGTLRVERGFIRPEDEEPEVDPDEADDDDDGVRVNEDGEIIEDGGDDPAPDPEDEDGGDAGKPISDALVRDLTAHRTLGLRLVLGEQPDIALVAVTHALVAQTYYRGSGEAHILEIRPTGSYLGSFADGIDDTAAAKALADRHEGWAADLPRDIAELWDFIAGLDHASVMALFAHCAALTVNAVRQPWERRPRQETAESLATALALDMTAHWTPTVRAYLGRVTKAHILAAVEDGVSAEAAERIKDMKKLPMAEAAEQLLAGTGWLPPLMRTARPAWLDAEPEQVPEDEAEPDGENFTIAAE